VSAGLLVFWHRTVRLVSVDVLALYVHVCEGVRVEGLLAAKACNFLFLYRNRNCPCAVLRDRVLGITKQEYVALG
jgi:hypothetical protein